MTQRLPGGADRCGEQEGGVVSPRRLPRRPAEVRDWTAARIAFARARAADKPVLVVDDGVEAVRAVRAVAASWSPARTYVHVVQVAALTDASIMTPDARRSAHARRVRAMRAVERLLHRRGLAHTSEVAATPAAAAIARAAQALAATMVVFCGEIADGELAASVAKLLHRSGCTVKVLRFGALERPSRGAGAALLPDDHITGSRPAIHAATPRHSRQGLETRTRRSIE